MKLSEVCLKNISTIVMIGFRFDCIKNSSDPFKLQILEEYKNNKPALVVCGFIVL